jgi:hypothetical protein
MMRKSLKSVILLLFLISVSSINSTACDVSTVRHTYGVGETIRIRISLDDDETGYRLTITDPNGQSRTFERYDLEPDSMYTVRVTASRTTGRRDIVLRAYDEDGERICRDSAHFHVNRVAEVRVSGDSSNQY